MSMSVAAIDDIVAWLILAVMLSLVTATSKLGCLWVILMIVGECLLIYFVVRPVLRHLDCYRMRTASIAFLIGQARVLNDRIRQAGRVYLFRFSHDI